MSEELREKVIEGLKHCGSLELCDDCVYLTDKRKGCGMFADALAMLNPTPRVMTPEEAASLPEGEVAWFEERYEKAGLSYIQPMMSNGAGMMIGPHLTVAPARMARRGRRFWTGKPDEKRREAEEWT